MRRDEELVQTTGPSRRAVAGREIVTEDVRARDLMFLEQPADQRCGSGGLRRSERISFAADVFDADGTSVGADTMIRAASALASDPSVRCKTIFVDLCSDIAGGTIRAAG